jgi:CRISPR-associated protein Cas2
MIVVVSYDIQHDRRRGRIHKTLKSYGQWVQFSVFECDLDRTNYLKLRDRLDRLLKSEEGDSIRFYFLCESCVARVERIGGPAPRDDGPILV